LTIAIAGSGMCTFGVDFDDGQARTLTERLPYRFTYRYSRPGEYTLVVWAHDPCTGSGDAVLRIRRR
jgi:hypothetical protein